jgi:hypothetical protein
MAEPRAAKAAEAVEEEEGEEVDETGVEAKDIELVMTQVRPSGPPGGGRGSGDGGARVWCTGRVSCTGCCGRLRVCV